MAHSGDADLILCPSGILPMVSGGAEIEQAPCWPVISSPNSEVKDKTKKPALNRLVHALVNADIACRELGHEANG